MVLDPSNPEAQPMKLCKKPWSTCLLLAVAGLMSACGSMFPAAPAERAVDKVIDEILVKKPKEARVAKPESVRA